jgi:hypothetical protein
MVMAGGVVDLVRGNDFGGGGFLDCRRIGSVHLAFGVWDLALGTWHLVFGVWAFVIRVESVAAGAHACRDRLSSAHNRPAGGFGHEDSPLLRWNRGNLIGEP